MSAPTRKELFAAKKKSPGSTVIPATVTFRHDKRQGRLHPLSMREKMIVAVKKILATMSDDDENGCRFYVDNNKIQVLREPSGSDARAGEARTYRASGRCAVGVCHPQGRKSSKIIQFDITYRDIKDARGLDDIEWIDPSTVEELPRNTPVDISALA